MALIGFNKFKLHNPIPVSGFIGFNKFKLHNPIPLLRHSLGLINLSYTIRFPYPDSLGLIKLSYPIRFLCLVFIEFIKFQLHNPIPVFIGFIKFKLPNPSPMNAENWIM